MHPKKRNSGGKVQCLQCGTVFEVKPWRLRKAAFCSYSCHRIFSRANPNHPRSMKPGHPPPTPSKFTPDMDAQLAILYSKGWGQTRIARELGVSPRTAGNRIVRLGIRDLERAAAWRPGKAWNKGQGYREFERLWMRHIAEGVAVAQRQDQMWGQSPEALAWRVRFIQNRCRKRLSPGYIRRVLASRSALTPKDFPPEMVELKRKQLEAKRLLRKGQQYGNQEHERHPQDSL